MKFKKIIIKNFRNFENINLDLENRNIIFGLNDIGKTNFLYAIRFLLDRNCRKQGLVDSDFFQKDSKREIEITLEIDISQEDNDTKKLRKHMGGAISSSAKSIFVQLKANSSKDNVISMPQLFWGVNIAQLEDIPSSQALYELDKIFNVIYIDSAVQLNTVFKHYTKEIFRSEKSLSEVEREKIKKNIDSLNNQISQLQTIKDLENSIKLEYAKYRDEKGLEISIKSEVELENVSSKLTPYINYTKGDTYPTSGDGRRKLLAYTMLTLENRKYEDIKINVFLIEELENHLHRSMQIALSYQLFKDSIFEYMFLTTHSSLIVSSMDKVNLIKLFKTNKIDGKSIHYSVPEEYAKLKTKLNQNLAEAIYADYVLLVEGPSERILFETMLVHKCADYEVKGGYILEVDGINFKQYVKILNALNVVSIVKTDNDLKLNKKGEYNYLGLNRALSLLGDKPVNNKKYLGKDFDIDKNVIKRNIYDSEYSIEVQNLKNKHIYLSRIDLENDLYDVIPNKMNEYIKMNNTKKNAIDYMQDAKMLHMIELCKLMTNITINTIYKHPLFSCVKELCELCNQ